MIDSLRKCRKHQLRCQEFYDAAASEVGQLNQLTTCQLNIYRPRFIELIKERSARLKGGRHKILILGRQFYFTALPTRLHVRAAKRDRPHIFEVRAASSRRQRVAQYSRRFEATANSEDNLSGNAIPRRIL